MNEEPINAEDTTEMSPPPGLRLKNARQSQGLQSIDVARELKLDHSLIVALEKGDPESLPQPVFTAGYIRSYARLVDLPADQLVADYVAMETKDLPSIPESPEKLPERYRRVAEALPKSFSIAAANSRNKVTVQYGAIVLGVVLVAIIIWQSARILSDDNKQVVEHATDIVARDMPTDGASQSLSLPNSEIKRAKTTDNIANDSSQGSANNPDVATNSSINKEKVERSEAIKYIEKRLPLKKLVKNNLGGDALALLEKQNTTDLNLTFRRTSWVEIKDSTGKRLIRQLGIAGNSRKVSGVAPFQVLLGNGHGVTIEYNGKEVDFSAYQRDTVARFTLEVPKEIKLN